MQDRSLLLVGFLLAGIVVGPHGFPLIATPEDVETLSELGVALLLFAVGLELSLRTRASTVPSLKDLPDAVLARHLDLIP